MYFANVGIFVRNCSRSMETGYAAAKARGNNFFKAGDYANAIACYSQAVELASVIPDDPEAQVVTLSALSNRSLCLIKLGRAVEASESAEAALKLRFACRAKPSVATKVALRLAAAAQMDPAAGGLAKARRAILEVSDFGIIHPFLYSHY